MYEGTMRLVKSPTMLLMGLWRKGASNIDLKYSIKLIRLTKLIYTKDTAGRKQKTLLLTLNRIPVMATWDDHDYASNNQGNDYNCLK